MFSDYVRFLNVSLPAGSVTDTAVAAGIDHAKLTHVHAYSGYEANPAASTLPIHIARNAGEIVAFKVALLDALPTSTRVLSVDLKVDGTTVLSATVDFDTSSVLDTVETGVLVGSPTVSPDDVVSVVLTYAGTGTDPDGLLFTVYISEAGM